VTAVSAGQSWPIRTIGRRGVFLVMFGVIYVAVGASVWGLETRRFTDIAPIIGPLLDSHGWGIMWALCGVLAVVTGVRRGQNAEDGLGFAALLVPPAAWTIFYAASVVAYLTTSGEFGRINSVPGVAVWSIVWFVILLVSGWPEAERQPRKRDDPVPPAEPPADEEG
jgi:hypothetical protein